MSAGTLPAPPADRYFEVSGDDYHLGPVAVIGRKNSGLKAPRWDRGFVAYDRGRPLREQLSGVVVHHTAGGAGETVGSIQAFHQGKRGWADIGYHYFIDREGRVFEGRPLGFVGAHAGKGVNRGLCGVALQGNFEIDDPTGAQVRSLRALLVEFCARFGLRVFLHREVRPGGGTLCPGKNLARRVIEWRESGVVQTETGPARDSGER